MLSRLSPLPPAPSFCSKEFMTPCAVGLFPVESDTDLNRAMGGSPSSFSLGSATLSIFLFKYCHPLETLLSSGWLRSEAFVHSINNSFFQ